MSVLFTCSLQVHPAPLWPPLLACSRVGIPRKFVRHLVGLLRPQSSSSVEKFSLSKGQSRRWWWWMGSFSGVGGVEGSREKEAMPMRTFPETIGTGMGMGMGKETKTARRVYVVEWGAAR